MKDREINIHNYEAYFLDYHEGKLSPSLVSELMDFLNEHPQLKSELDEFESITINETEEIAFVQKESLKKQTTTINASNFDEYAIANMEGTLPEFLQQELKIFISQNPTYKRELELYTKTKLIPDSSIIFKQKHLLKKREKRSVAVYYWSAAASVALIIGFYFLLNTNKNNPSTIAVKHDTTKDSNTVATHIEKNINNHISDSATSAKTPLNKQITPNRAIAINRTTQRKKSIHNNVLNTPVIAKRGDNTIKELPVKNQESIPAITENLNVAFYQNIQDTAVIYNLLKKDHSSETSQPEIATTDGPKYRSKFFYLLAKYTCKGLRKVSGQKIEMEEKFNPDNNSLVAYQLDLGNKKIEIPVKE